MQNNGITILKDYVLTSRKTRNELYNMDVESIVIEDAGKAKQFLKNYL